MAIALNPAHHSMPGYANLREKAVELEGVFLNTLVSEMFKGLETDSMFGGGYAEETWRGMMAEQYAAEMAQAGGIGIADQMVAALIETQAAQDSAPQLSSMGAYR
ncbi:rod-binding protein [Pelagibacterium halotolerans]|uniref:Flagellar protein FlgJ N-terminal domain-containing protein n=1 Tax=Pelagibacterium halotolerans (strain DSM 22347 / JCM 15775 / CGMCC 1.7692 / B2) TaxID=1082931 RepID=G4RER2_PELHB|nr:rod-binding protein [Pelagibacterium halotolerans]AEQ51883.1 hypothetical protein KKY_1872 [Pelagibacterium halotolerans B2]QJR18313.1 hypothetical protein HKM20_07640 [Pelagibacterium halotolerans]SEA25979.1 Rod binding protein [Pelagibacterium halotolerans]